MGTAADCGVGELQAESDSPDRAAGTGGSGGV